MRDKIKRFIEDNALISRGDKVIVALSGGADSTALLHILISIKEEYDLEVLSAHFHHGIRGEEADRDADFVRELCKRWNIELYLEKADVPAVAEETGESTELCGRRLRYAFLQRCAKEHAGAKIATAHHRGDNAETVLWNLTRGAGIDGLSGIPAIRDNIIRPLLCCSRAEIEAYCAENDLAYVTDSTNLSDDYTRNKLRRQVLPVLRELNEGVEENIMRTASLMRDADEYLNKISITELNEAKTNFGYSCEELLKLDKAVLQYAVKNLLELEEAPVDCRHIALIIDAMQKGGAVQLGRGFTAVCAQGTLRIVADSGDHQDDDACIPLTEYLKNHGTVISVRAGRLDFCGHKIPYMTEEGAKINNLLLNNCIPCDIITSDVVLRHRRAGDTFSDARRGVTKTLKKLMNELKIPRELRDDYLVIAKGSTVLWLQGYGTSAQAAVDLTRDGDIILIMGE